MKRSLTSNFEKDGQVFYPEAQDMNPPNTKKPKTDEKRLTENEYPDPSEALVILKRRNYVVSPSDMTLRHISLSDINTYNHLHRIIMENYYASRGWTDDTQHRLKRSDAVYGSDLSKLILSNIE